ncbi:MAG: lipopolysaccharide assembly protein LapA domain-containing protein, partial [Desulfobacterales bacterium]|nr:lipopolysaccharide assembly protein LapA domain-containing protein [Desulfobacterales bacterium]
KKTKKGKIVFWIIFTVLALILYFQNQGFFMHEDKLALNLFVFEFNTSPLPMVVFVAGFFFIGFIIAFFFALIERFRTKKIIQDLKMKLDEQDKLLNLQKNEVDRLRTVLREGPEVYPEVKDTGAKESVS